MPNITVSVSPELKKKLEKFREVSWSRVVEQLLSEKVKRMELLGELDAALANSTLSEKDSVALGKKLKKNIAKKFSQ